jgi:hypothetical protein
MRTVAMLALAAAFLMASACGTDRWVECGPNGLGTALITMYLVPESAVTPPETVVVSSPIHATGDLPAIDGDDAGSWGQFVLHASSPGLELSGNPWGRVSNDASGDRLLGINWQFVDRDANSPPGDLFDVTVTDAAGTVTGRFEQTRNYTWSPPMGCEQSGHWTVWAVWDDGGTD